MTILTSATQEMARPDFRFVLCRKKFLKHQKARAIEANRVNAHHLDALIQKIFDRIRDATDVFVDVIIRPQEFIAAGIDENDVQGSKLIVNFLEGFDDVIL